MSMMRIVEPLPFSIVAAETTSPASAANLCTPSPREVYAPGASSTEIVIDLGTICAVDTFFLGFTSAGADDTLRIRDVSGNEICTVAFAHSYRRAPLRHAFFCSPALHVGEFFRLTVTTAAPLVAGVLALGQAIRPGAQLSGGAGSYEYGAGRQAGDTSRVERLPAGGFGIGRGATAGGWSGVLPSLSDEEADRLYALQLDRGTSAPILVLEDEGGGLGANERAHWSLFRSLEPAERQAPNETKLNMTLWDFG